MTFRGWRVGHNEPGVAVGRYRFEAMIEWNRGTGTFRQLKIPIESYTPYDSWSPGSSMRSDNASTKTQLLLIDQAIMKNEGFSLVLPSVFGHQFSRPNWEIMAIIIDAFEGKRNVHTLRCFKPQQPVSAAVDGRQLMSFDCTGFSYVVV
jgi:hypothetical protein